MLSELINMFMKIKEGWLEWKSIFWIGLFLGVGCFFFQKIPAFKSNLISYTLLILVALCILGIYVCLCAWHVGKSKEAQFKSG